ncbi:permease-like cell division protein FtsX [Candidatus Saccharibacteria bacterium]|nr:permease-like cell division protein FtsX [Candidatus Saccharibacteria bacterium]
MAKEKEEKKENKVSKDRKLKTTAKKSLKTMQRTRKKHPLRTQARIAKYGAKGFGRNIWLSTAATAVMSITLIILFVTVVASVILTNTAEMMKDKIDITIYLKPGVASQQLEVLKGMVASDPNVKSVEASNSEEEYEKFLKENEGSDEVISVLDEDMRKMMISKMQGTIRIKVYNVDDLSSIKKIVEEDEEFKLFVDKEKAPTYDVNQAEIATITTWARIARTGGFILAIVFLVISVLIIFSTIRMAIFSRREEIYMMKLVGAEKNFIRGPFLIEAEICGLIAGVIAATISFFGFMFMAPKLSGYGIDVSTITDVLESNKLILVYLVFMVLGVVIGRLSARLAVSKYLNKA